MICVQSKKESATKKAWIQTDLVRDTPFLELSVLGCMPAHHDNSWDLAKLFLGEYCLDTPNKFYASAALPCPQRMSSVVSFNLLSKDVLHVYLARPNCQES